jgi:predicted transcriptional regulator
VSKSEREHKGPEQTLLAIKEFAHYLERMEKDLSNTSKRLRNKETAQSAGFVAAGIHEALQYLAVVKKVIEQTQRIIAKRALGPKQESGISRVDSNKDGASPIVSTPEDLLSQSREESS